MTKQTAEVLPSDREWNTVMPNQEWKQNTPCEKDCVLQKCAAYDIDYYVYCIRQHILYRT